MKSATTDSKRKTGAGSKATAAGPLSAGELRKLHVCWRAVAAAARPGARREIESETRQDLP